MIKFKAKTPNGEIINSALSEFVFPAGEAHIKREERRELEPTEIAVIQGSSSIHNDLFALAMWNNYLEAYETMPKRVLVIPYFPGARADRGFPFGARVYAEFVGSMNLDEIILFDPHSPTIVTEIPLEVDCGVTVVYSDELLKTRDSKIVMPNIYTGIIAPDKGAKVRAGAVAKAFDIPVYTAEKTRDFETGKLTGFAIEELPENGRFLIVDDICDGGGTFCGLADVIRTLYPQVSLDLFVSHGVFSGNAYFNLSKYFDAVYTTNSYDAETKPPSFFFEKGNTKIRQVTNFKTIDVLRLLLAKVK